MLEVLVVGDDVPVGVGAVEGPVEVAVGVTVVVAVSVVVTVTAGAGAAVLPPDLSHAVTNASRAISAEAAAVDRAGADARRRREESMTGPSHRVVASASTATRQNG